MTISQLSIFVENRPGTLYEITDTLGHAGVDIRAMSIADTKDFGIMRLIVNDIEKAKKALEDNGYVVSETPVIAAAVFDRPGALTDIMKLWQTTELILNICMPLLPYPNSMPIL